MRGLSIILLTLFAVILGFTSPAYTAENFKIGSIDSDRIRRESKKINEVLKSVEEFAKNKEKQLGLENDEKELKKLEEEYEKQKSVLSPEARIGMVEQFNKKLEEYQKKKVAFLDETRKKEAEVSKPLGQKIENIVKSIGKKEGFDLIVDKRGIIYSRDDFYSFDLTDRIIKEIDLQK